MSLEINTDDLMKKLQSLQKKMSNKISKEALEAGANVMLKSQKAEAPYDTGELKKSLDKSKVKTKKGSKSIDIGTMKAPKEVQKYAYCQNYGFRGVLGTYFMEEAYEKGAPASLEVMKKTIANGLKE